MSMAPTDFLRTTDVTRRSGRLTSEAVASVASEAVVTTLYAPPRLVGAYTVTVPYPTEETDDDADSALLDAWIAAASDGDELAYDDPEVWATERSEMSAAIFEDYLSTREDI